MKSKQNLLKYNFYALIGFFFLEHRREEEGERDYAKVFIKKCW